MCTNYRLAIQDKDQLEVWFGHLSMADWLNPEPRKTHEREFYPGYEAPVVHAGSRVLARYRWGFDNFMDPKYLLVNAKAETAAGLRTFKKAFAATRCLVLANGFYDYRGSDPKGAKRRYLFEVPGVDVYAMAGLWQERNGVRQYTIITTEPNAVVKEFHHRMPVILDKADYDRWLDPKATVAELQDLLRLWGGKMTATEAPKGGAVKAEAESVASTPKKAPAKKSVAEKPTKNGS